MDEAKIEIICEVMHIAYEDAARESGWETNPKSRVDWIDVPEANKIPMRAAVVAAIPFVLTLHREQLWSGGCTS